MKTIVLIALLLTTGCSNAMFLTDEQKAIYRAIEQNRLGKSEGPKLSLKEHSRKEIVYNGERKALIDYTLEVTGTCPGESYDFYIVRQDGT